MVDGRRFDVDAVSFSWATWTDVGKRRTINEDRLLALPGLFVVADGMGGHGSGDVASTAAVEALGCQGDPPFDVEQVPGLLASARRAVDRAARADQLDMGTTLVAAIWAERGGHPCIVIAHIGDSRCYETGPDGMRLITRDHSVVQELIEAGDLTPTQALRHPDRHVITRSLGGSSTDGADYVVLGPTSPQRLLLCSDGVSGPLDEFTIADCIDINQTPAESAAMLADRVLSGPAPDNATAIVIDAEWDPAVLAAAADRGGDTRPHPQRLSADSVPTARGNPRTRRADLPATGRQR